MKKHNFSAGPAILPEEVINGASEAVLELDGSGLSLIEISHRSNEFKTIMEEKVMKKWRDWVGTCCNILD